MTAQIVDLSPHLPTAELLIPLKPQIHRTRFVRRTFRTRATRFVQANGWALAWSIAVCVVAAYVVVQALTGGGR
jgi:hypothetical protein